MGWCSGTEIFDGMVKEIIKMHYDDSSKTRLVRKLVQLLEDHDWDCQYDSDFYDHPIVEAATPDWDRDS